MSALAPAHPEVPPLAGRVALVTGANSGIGRVTARELAAQGAHVFIACRSPDRAAPALEELRAHGNPAGGKVELLPLDLGDLSSVRRCAARFLDRNLPLHLLVNNAGLAGARGLTASGFELAFGTNHVGHFLLTQLLLECLVNSAPARVVTVASQGHAYASGIDWGAVRQPTASSTGLPEYCVSKLANVLFSAELGRQLQGRGVTTYALHPGAVATEVWRSVPGWLRGVIKLFMLSNEKGAATTLYCATSPQVAAPTGLYYEKCRVRTPSSAAQDAFLAAELWRRSQAWVAA